MISSTPISMRNLSEYPQRRKPLSQNGLRNFATPMAMNASAARICAIQISAATNLTMRIEPPADRTVGQSGGRAHAVCREAAWRRREADRDAAHLNLLRASGHDRC